MKNITKEFYEIINPEKFQTVSSMFVAYHQQKENLKVKYDLGEGEVREAFLQFLDETITPKPKTYITKEQPYGWAYSKVKSIIVQGLRFAGYMDYVNFIELAKCAYKDGELKKITTKDIDKMKIEHIEVLPDGWFRDYLVLNKRGAEIVFSIVDLEDDEYIPDDTLCKQFFIIHYMNEIAVNVEIVKGL